MKNKGKLALAANGNKICLSWNTKTGEEKRVFKKRIKMTIAK